MNVVAHPHAPAHPLALLTQVGIESFVYYPTRSKAPRERNWQANPRRAAEYQEGSNVGVLLGQPVPGGFLADIDFDSPPSPHIARATLPDEGIGFGRASRPLSHLFVAVPERVRSRQYLDLDNKVIVELRCAKADGSIGYQTMVPPSVHPSGEPLTFHPVNVVFKPVEDLERRVLLYAVGSLLGVHLVPGAFHHQGRLNLAGFLLRGGVEVDEGVRLVRALATVSGNDAADAERALRDTAKALERGQGVTASLDGVVNAGVVADVSRRLREWLGIADVFPNTEVGDAEAFTAAHGDRVRYDHRRGRTLLHDPASGLWLSDPVETLRALAVGVVRQRQRDAVNLADKDERRKAFNWALAGESTTRLNNLLREARAMPPIADDGEGWDDDPYLLGCTNGVVDLRTGELRKGRPEDRVTMRASVPYDPSAICPLWQETLDAIFNDDELLVFVHLALGYSLTGDCREECLFLMYGSGGNGEGTLINTVSRVVGEYGDDVPFSTLERRERSSIPADVAKLVGKRFVTASESGGAAELNVERIKALTGRDPITARFMRENFFTFEPVAKFWLSSNEKPVVRDDSDGFWRRVHLIPFTQSFVGRADTTLKDRLKAEHPGILAWLVKGAVMWQREGLHPPAIVRAATQEYRNENDRLAPFIDECCVLGDTYSTKASTLFERYREWSNDAGLPKWDVLTMNAFGRQIRKRFAVKERRTVEYFGVAVRETERKGGGDAVPF